MSVFGDVRCHRAATSRIGGALCAARGIIKTPAAASQFLQTPGTYLRRAGKRVRTPADHIVRAKLPRFWANRRGARSPPKWTIRGQKPR
jgi:hypothetical protein